MTGEMARICPRSGRDSNGDEWPVHLAVARSVGGELRPFDVYCGPYILTDTGCLWISSDDGYHGEVFNERTRRIERFAPMSNTRRACAAARRCLNEEGEIVP